MITDEMFKKGKFWDKGPMVVTGCTKVSEGCKNCWSEKAHVMRSSPKSQPHLYRPDSLTNKRFNGKVYFNLNRLQDAVEGKSAVIAIWNDLYHEDVKLRYISKAYEIMTQNPQHVFLVITKRIDTAADYCYGHEVPSHIWHFATMENQKMADKRMGDLLRIPGKRGIIIEPMLGPVDLSDTLYCSWTEAMEEPFNEVYCANYCDPDSEGCDGKPSSLLHQVILGPENGLGKRPFKEEWAESVKAQCEVAGVPFYRKDKGEGELSWKEDSNEG